MNRFGQLTQAEATRALNLENGRESSGTGCRFDLPVLSDFRLQSFRRDALGIDSTCGIMNDNRMKIRSNAGEDATNFDRVTAIGLFAAQSSHFVHARESVFGREHCEVMRDFFWFTDF